MYPWSLTGEPRLNLCRSRDMAWHQPPPLRQPLKFEVFSEDSLLLLLSILCIFVLNLTLQSYLNTRLLFLYLVKYSWNSLSQFIPRIRPSPCPQHARYRPAQRSWRSCPWAIRYECLSFIYSYGCFGSFPSVKKECFLFISFCG